MYRHTDHLIVKYTGGPEGKAPITAHCSCTHTATGDTCEQADLRLEAHLPPPTPAELAMEKWDEICIRVAAEVLDQSYALDRHSDYPACRREAGHIHELAEMIKNLPSEPPSAITSYTGEPVDYTAITIDLAQDGSAIDPATAPAHIKRSAEIWQAISKRTAAIVELQAQGFTRHDYPGPQLEAHCLRTLAVWLKRHEDAPPAWLAIL